MQAHMKKFSPSPRRRASIAPVILIIMTALTGCAQSIPTALPDLKRPDADGMLVPAQQKKAIEELAQKKAETEAQAVKQIENSR
jgi:uncharacterized membrane protein